MHETLKAINELVHTIIITENILSACILHQCIRAAFHTLYKQRKLLICTCILNAIPPIMTGTSV